MLPASGRRSDIIVLDMILKLRLELIQCRNDNAMEKFYWLEVFENVRFLMEISKILKIKKNAYFS